MRLALKFLGDLLQEGAPIDTKHRAHMPGGQKHPGYTTGIVNHPGFKAVIELDARSLQQLLAVIFVEGQEGEPTQPRIASEAECGARQPPNRERKGSASNLRAPDSRSGKVLGKFESRFVYKRDHSAAGRSQPAQGIYIGCLALQSFNETGIPVSCGLQRHPRLSHHVCPGEDDHTDSRVCYPIIQFADDLIAPDERRFGECLHAPVCIPAFAPRPKRRRREKGGT